MSPAWAYQIREGRGVIGWFPEARYDVPTDTFVFPNGVSVWFGVATVVVSGARGTRTLPADCITRHCLRNAMEGVC